ncbi:MAG: PEP-CTERM sorting domain-containing protein [Lentisphaerae bacterium]|nr:PEP-CTERM sorting domain-containing protein [Lentisphaerota bacterium]
MAANTGSGTALDGNAAANRIAGVSFAPTVTWNNGSSLWIRFRELNDTGNDHGLSVDNFQLTVVPEPATVGLLAGPGLGILVACMRRRREDEAGA